MDILTLLPSIYDKLIVFTLIFSRIGATLSTFVIFKREMITSRMMISLSFLLSCYVLLIVNPNSSYSSLISVQSATNLIYQTLIGFMIGLILNILFEVFIAVGQIISGQIGLSMASLIDPRFGFITTLTHFYVITATIIFLSLNGQLFLMKLLVDSFTVIPVDSAIFTALSLKPLLGFGSIIFSDAILLSMTVIIVLMLTNISLAVMSKFAPQFNLFSIGINMQLMIGLFCLFITFGLFVDQSQQLINDALHFIKNFVDLQVTHVRSSS